VSEKLLTIPEAAELLQLHPETVRNWIRDGRLPGGMKLGRLWRIRLSALTAWMDEKAGKGQGVLPGVRA
jgi:excisionase family DNA binding protein